MPIRSTRRKIVNLLINTRDHEMPRRDILMRLRYRPDFEFDYNLLIRCGIIQEYGQGTKYSPRITRLLLPDADLADSQNG